MKKQLLILVLLGFITPIACKKSETSKVPSTLYVSELETSNNNNSDDSYHVDDNYKYEHRTGSSGNYEYNYDVSGDGVEGNVDMQGKYGSGTITDEYGNEKDVEVEWVDYGVMEATDEDGNTYTMEVD